MFSANVLIAEKTLPNCSYEKHRQHAVCTLGDSFRPHFSFIVMFIALTSCSAKKFFSWRQNSHQMFHSRWFHALAVERQLPSQGTGYFSGQLGGGLESICLSLLCCPPPPPLQICYWHGKLAFNPLQHGTSRLLSFDFFPRCA